MTKLEKPIRRTIVVAGAPWVVEIAPAGIMFRPRGRRSRIVAPWSAAIALAERLSGEDAHRERLRTGALRRISRARR
jgi:hypothetical protein